MLNKALGSPASKRRPIELHEQAGYSLHRVVATCTSLLNPVIIPSTSLLQSVGSGKTGLRTVVTASGQHGDLHTVQRAQAS